MKKKNTHNINKTGFKVPKDYFDNFEDFVLSEIKLKETIKNHGFNVPDDYFETLKIEILSKVSKKDPVKIIPLFNKRTLIYASSIAATILLLFNLSIFEKNISFDSLDIETAENYIIEENIGSYEIASLLSDYDFNEENFVNYSFNEENLENYLLENLDVDDLITE